MTSRSWSRKLFGRPATGAIRKGPARCRPTLECLEARVVPVVTAIDFGGLHFVDPAGFTKNAAGDDQAVDGIVSIGYTPSPLPANSPPGTPPTPFYPLLLADVNQG